MGEKRQVRQPGLPQTDWWGGSQLRREASRGPIAQSTGNDNGEWGAGLRCGSEVELASFADPLCI